MRRTTPAGRLIQDLAERAFLTPMCRRPRVGEVIEHLSPEKREVIKTLCSKDMDSIRVPDWV